MANWELLGLRFITEREDELSEGLSAERLEAFRNNEWEPYTIWLEADLAFRLIANTPTQTLQSTKLFEVASDISRSVLRSCIWMCMSQLCAMLNSLGISDTVIEVQKASFWTSLCDQDFSRYDGRY